MTKAPDDRPGDAPTASDAQQTGVQVEGSSKPKRTPFPVVGIGASAGGLEAFEEFFAHMPGQPGAAFVLVMHLDPHHKSMLPELLGKATGLEVVQAEDGMTIAPNRIFTIAPNTSIYLEGDKLRLDEPKGERGLRKPIDELFRSLAEQQGERAVGIVLSGTGSDGTQGLREIKFAGGLAMIQDPATAKFESMPQSALNAGVVDVSLPAAQLAERLAELMAKRRDVLTDEEETAETRENESIQAILEEVHSQTGRDLSGYKRPTLRRRMEKRMLLRERTDLDSYRRLLRQDEGEVQSLLMEMLISVTSFFRDAKAFQAIEEKLLPKLFARPASEPLRIWVPGCATGEEAYSLAMLLTAFMEDRKVRRKIQLFATDLDDRAIAAARAGKYPESAVADVPERFRKRYLRQQNGHYVVSTPVREMVVFATHDLIEQPPFFRLDLISCRNLLIYLTSEVQRKVISLFFHALVPGGFLVLGPAESLGKLESLFMPLDTKWKVYQRRDVAADKVDIPLAPRSLVRQQFHPGLAPGAASMSGSGVMLRDALLELFGHPSVLLNGRDEVVHVYGDPHAYLGLADGDPSADVYRMAREPLRVHLRSALHKARKSGETVIYQNIATDENGKQVDLLVKPVPRQKADKDLALVVFQSREALAQSQGMVPPEISRDEVVRQLEEELKLSHDQLQSTVEDLETSNEELTSSNEELQSMNEELQSTNEELETSQEELQALNEELSTVNAELQAKIAELDEAKSDLENLLRSTDIATIFIDREFIIRQFTPAASQIFNLVANDEGRPLQHITSKVPDEDIIEDAREVLEHLTPCEKELRSEDDRWYLSRILPYRTLDDTIEGVVLTYVDITERRRAEEELRISRERLAIALSATGAGVYDHQVPLDATTYHSEQWAHILGFSKSELPRHDVFMDWLAQRVHPDDAERLATAYEAFISGERPDYDVEIRLKHKNGEYVWVRGVSRAVERDADGRATRVVGLMMDITARKQIEEELRANKLDLEKRVADRTRDLAVSQARLQAMVDNFPNGSVLLFDHDLRYLVAGGEALKRVGRDRDAYQGRTVQDVQGPELAETLEPIFKDVLQGHKRRFEIELAGDSFDVWALPVLDKDGGVMAGMVMSQMVTEQRRLQQELSESDARHRSLVANYPDSLVVLFDRDQRFLIAGGEGMDHMAGSPAELEGLSLRQALPDLAADLEPYFRDALQGQDSEFELERHGHVYAVQVTYVSGDGGNVAGGLMLAKDVTERRRMERELSVSREEAQHRATELEGTLASLPDAVVILGPRGETVLANGPARNLARMLDDDAAAGDDTAVDLDSRIFAHMRTNGVPLPEDELPSRRALAGETIRQQRYRIDCPDGSELWLALSAAPVRDQGGHVLGAVVTFADVSGQVGMEDQLKAARNMAQAANAAKTAFLANMSHEIRNPLNGILGMASLLGRQVQDPDLREYVELIVAAGRQLQAIIEDVLDISRIEADRVVIDPKPTDPRELLRRLKAMHQAMASRKGLTLELDIDESVPKRLLLDPDRVAQVLTNLISNALKFTEKGGVVVSVALELRGRSNLLCFAVQDSGVGIAQEQLERIFESFYQVENYLTKEQQGTGLGLAISKRLVDIMGGSLEVRSEPGGGSIFFFTLPCHEVEDTIEPVEIDDGGAELAELGPLKVLVAEDNMINRLLLKELLTSAGMEYAEAVNGQEALDKLAAEDFDVVLMDIQMPQMDGQEATRRIRASEDERVRTTKVVALTAYAMAEDRDKFLKAGMDGYLAKPVALGELARVLKQVLGK